MKQSLSKISLATFIFLSQGKGFASNKPKVSATVTCAGAGSSNLTYGNGQLVFPDGYFGTPNLKKIEGTVSLVLPLETKISDFKVSGFHVASEFGEPNHWIMNLRASNGELGSFVLSRDNNYEDNAYGKVEPENTKPISASCKILIHFPSDPNKEPHCNPHDCG